MIYSPSPSNRFSYNFYWIEEMGIINNLQKKNIKLLPEIKRCYVIIEMPARKKNSM